MTKPLKTSLRQLKAIELLLMLAIDQCMEGLVLMKLL